MLTTTDFIQEHLLLVRGHQVLLQTDLARLLGVPPERLLPPTHTYPGEFCFPLEPAEVVMLTDDSCKHDQPIHAYSEQGAFLAAFLLNTPESLAMGIQIARAFASRSRT
jgi:hypothetical protein